jgi:hypothetical protein
MEYTVNGIITLSPASKIRLSSDMSFISPSKAEVTLSSRSDEELSVLIKLEAENDAIARECAMVELGMVCDLLSFYCNTVILKSGISGVSCTSIKRGYVDVSARFKVGSRMTVSGVVTLGDKSLAKLTSNLRKDYPVDCREAIYMWREAISNESSVLRYLLLYRLLEFLFESDTETLTSWIINKDPKVQLVDDRKRGKTTSYTSLRDHIHPKEKDFPIKEIQGNVDKLQTLVQQRIKEKYNIQ